MHAYDRQEISMRGRNPEKVGRGFDRQLMHIAKYYWLANIVGVSPLKESHVNT